MKGNYSLVQLAEEVQRVENTKKDFMYPTKDLRMCDDEVLEIPGGMTLGINKNAHNQIADRLNIPIKYYNKMAAIPGLRDENVNAWMKQSTGKNLIRTLDGTTRAFLSDRFKPIDNFLILNGFLPVIKEMNMQVKACSMTDQKMYVQVVFPEIKAEIIPGDVVNLGIVLTNSEVGRGAVDVSTVVWRLVCSNGMIGESVMNKYHVGRRIGDDIQDYDIFQDDTIKAELDSFSKRLRDVFAATVSDVSFMHTVNKMKAAAAQEIDDVVGTVGNVTRKYNLTLNEEKLIIKNMVTEGMNSRWGLANGITAMAHDIESQDRQFEVEKIGHNVINLKPNEWHEIAV